VIYDEKREVLYVSSINGSGMEKVENGFISKLSLEGEIVELKWFSESLWAPKGMAIFDDHLFVADISRVVEIDLETGKLVKTYPVAEAVFLNDVTADINGDIYISDMMTNTIHRIKDGKIESWLTSEKLASPNGLVVVDEQLVVGTWGVMDGEGFATSTPGHLINISLCGKGITDRVSSDPIGNLDGLEISANGNFLATDWLAGKLLLIDSKGTVETLLDLDQGSADLDYIHESGLIVIPMMMDNKVVAYRFQH
jgi:sugar lactone lactonase YvrE